MGFLGRKKKDKTSDSARATRDEALTQGSAAPDGVSSVNHNSKKQSSTREVSKARFEEEPAAVNKREDHDIDMASTENSSEEEHHRSAAERQSGGGSQNNKTPWFMTRSTKLFKKPPRPEEAAYSGPPRYDWVDIETAAAIKVQAAYRRQRVMKMMEEEGAPTTSAVRNLARRRKAAKEHEANPAQDFVDLFNCCGVDLGLGGGNKETYYDMTREMEKARYEEQLRKKQEREEMLRKSYKKKVVRESLVENVEVVQ